MTRPTPAVRALYEQETAAARRSDDPALRWHHLERAHIVSQPHAWLHTRNHVAMLAVALRRHDRREALGQVVRIVVAAPGSWTGRFPDGNTGRVSAGLMTPLPLPADLAPALGR
ncbi:DUF3703 domain-containing protein [Geodermatophilus sp. SYSU D00703]